MAIEVTKNLRLAFEGKLVTIVLRNIHAYVIEKTRNEEVQVKGSAVTMGVWLDYDQQFIYLGTEAGEIEEAVALENIAIVRLYDEAQNFVSFPESEAEIN